MSFISASSMYALYAHHAKEQQWTSATPLHRRRRNTQLPIGPIVVPFWGSYVESYKVIPKGTTMGLTGRDSSTLNPINPKLDRPATLTCASLLRSIRPGVRPSPCSLRSTVRSRAQDGPDMPFQKVIRVAP